MMAIKVEMDRLGADAGKPGKNYHKQAVANVKADPTAHGISLDPTHGWCGLGGKP
ncbi:hypothetical protein P7F88_25395 [Vibrio hannami]|uniref:hypothetical protein n=1 Tax=Vibrio hannami TaxID=2717094 RepID=UPI00240F52DD|nr:hypothetical protein [Vibrio hannami]MDG3089201.1 hypothetical protein [Vibrio hannami]